MTDDLRQLLKIPTSRLDDINAILIDPDMRVVNDFLDVVAKFGTPEEINRKAKEARKLPALYKKVEETKPEFLADLKWLEEQCNNGAFISIAEYRQKVLGKLARTTTFKDEFAVTLEVSACQYFPWVIAAAKRAINDRVLMPGRFIKVRKMKEQEADCDLWQLGADANHRG
jgi:hypothetical protein